MKNAISILLVVSLPFLGGCVASQKSVDALRVEVEKTNKRVNENNGLLDGIAKREYHQAPEDPKAAINAHEAARLASSKLDEDIDLPQSFDMGAIFKGLMQMMKGAATGDWATVLGGGGLLATIAGQYIYGRRKEKKHIAKEKKLANLPPEEARKVLES